jgi:hypothetical protein
MHLLGIERCRLGTAFHFRQDNIFLFHTKLKMRLGPTKPPYGMGIRCPLPQGNAAGT